jgi:small GTP-binding protein
LVQNEFDYSVMVVAIGDSGAGKSCFLGHFVRGEFNSALTPTELVDFQTKVVSTARCRVQLQLWDTAGQEAFHSVTRSLYRNAAGAILLFDLTSRASFEGLGSWLRDLRSEARPEVVIVLAGNKVDLLEERAVASNEAEDFAAEQGIVYFETSAKTGDMVSETIEYLVTAIEKKIDEGASEVALKEEMTVLRTESEAPSGCRC